MCRGGGERFLGEEDDDGAIRIAVKRRLCDQAQWFLAQSPLFLVWFGEGKKVQGVRERWRNTRKIWGEISSSGRTYGRAALLGYNSKMSSSNVQANAWLDVRVIYVRVSGCPLDDDAPDSLTVRFPARSIGIALEVNGGRISPSEEALLVLRRDRIDTESAEATYVSTDNLRASGASVSYQVFNRDEALLSGTIEQQSEPRPPPADAANSTHQEWKMECNCVVGQSGCVFLKGRNDYPSMSLAPAPVVEVCVVGRLSGTPVILTRTVQMSARRRLNRQITLDAIPESEAVGRTSTSSLIAMDHQPQLVVGSNPFMDLTDKATTAFGYGLEGSGYGESDGEMTWFNAGVRVGVGIGLGMCLGVGIGVGLMVRTYQATARTFRRGFF